MPPIFLLAVKVAFLAALYLFVARAVRAVVLDVLGPRARRKPVQRAAARAAPRAAPARPPRRLPRSLLVNDSAGRRTVPLQASLTVGRAATCDVVISDTYVSNVHARLFERDGSFWVEDLGSTNGSYVRQTKVVVPTPVGPGDQVRLGKATLELRR